MTVILLWLQIVVQAGAPPEPQSTFPFAPNMEAALKEAKNRQAALLVCNFDTWPLKRKPQSKSPGLDEVFADQNLAAAVQKVVCVLASQEKHGDRKQTIDGVERTVCQTFGWAPCSSHKAVLDWSFRKFAEGGVLTSPYVVLVGPNGDTLASFFHEQDAGELAEAINRAVADLPKSLDAASYARCRMLMERSAAAEKTRDLLTAREAWESIQTLAKGYPLADEAQTALMRINDLGRARKNDLVAKVEQGDKRQNLFALDDLAFALGDLASAEQARAAVDELLAKAGFIEYQPALERYRGARDAYHKARRLAADGKRDQARRLLVDSSKRFTSTPFEADATKLLDELNKKPAKPKKP